MNTIVNFETAKLLKKKRFDVVMKEHYSNYNKRKLVTSDIVRKCNWNNFTDMAGSDDYYSAPTIAETIMWLYEKHGIWISVSITIQKKYYYECLDITGEKDPTKNNYPSRICKPGNYFNSPTKAYQEAIKYTLKKLIK